MTLLQNKTIAIIGGGPGGLTLARLLQKKGANVKVYERDYDRNVRVQGTRLDLSIDSGLKALQEASLMEVFKANYRSDNERTRVVDENAKVFLDYKEEATGDFGDKGFRPEIERGKLRTILLDSLQPETVVWNSHIVSVEKSDKIFRLIFENDTIANADIIIGADGANSKIRQFVTSVKPSYSGVSILQGCIYDPEKNAPKINDLFKDGKIMALGNSQAITVVSAKGSETLDFALSWKTDADWLDNKIDFSNRKEVLEWFKNEYANWNSIWQELFEAENTRFILRPQYCMPLDQKWETQPNITLIGDAVHLMPPFAGEGVNMAMRDAFELSESLTNGKFKDLQSAIANYENQMLARFAAIRKMTLDNGEILHSPEGLNKMLSIKFKTVNFK